MNQDTIESSLRTVSTKITSSDKIRRGSILIRFVDSGDEYHFEMTEREARVVRPAPNAVPLVEISGPTAILKEVMDGSREASSAFLAGGIQVRGDVQYLESLLTDIGMLHSK